MDNKEQEYARRQRIFVTVDHLINMLKALDKATPVIVEDTKRIVEITLHPVFRNDIILMLKDDTQNFTIQDTLGLISKFDPNLLDHSTGKLSPYLHAPVWVTYEDSVQTFKPAVAIKLNQVGLTIVTV